MSLSHLVSGSRTTCSISTLIQGPWCGWDNRAGASWVAGASSLQGGDGAPPPSPWQGTLSPQPSPTPHLSLETQDLSTHPPPPAQEASTPSMARHVPLLCPQVAAPLFTAPASSPGHSLVYKAHQLPAPPAKVLSLQATPTSLSVWHPLVHPLQSFPWEWPGDAASCTLRSVLLCLGFPRRGGWESF